MWSQRFRSESRLIQLKFRSLENGFSLLKNNATQKRQNNTEHVFSMIWCRWCGQFTFQVSNCSILWGDAMKKFSGNCSIFEGTSPLLTLQGHMVILVLGRHVVTIVHVCYRLLFSICRYQSDSFCSLSEISITYIFTTMNKDTMNKCCIYI